jgi:hypothetical protein
MLEVGVANAETIVSSFSSGQSTIYFPLSGAWVASPFQTDAQSWTLSSVSIGLLAPDLSILSVYLLSDNTGTPGTPLTGLQFNSNVDSIYTFDVTNTIMLNPSTMYWIGIGNTPNSVLRVTFSDFENPNSFNFIGVPDALMPESVSSSASSENPPTTWNAPGNGGALLFNVDGSPIPVPEPKQLLPISLSVVIFFIRRLKRLKIDSGKRF